MPVDIPGFYYDPVKKKYFKMVANSSSSNNKYSASSLKHERDETEIKRKISKLKIHEGSKSKLPFILSDKVLGIRNKLRFDTFDSNVSNYYHYRLESLKPNNGLLKLGCNVYQPSGTHIPIRKILKHKDDLIIGKDSYIHLYRIKDIRNPHDDGRVDSYLDNYEHYLNHSILRNLETYKEDMFVRTWCGLMNEPSLIQVLQGYEIRYSNDFPNESIKNSKCAENKIFTCSDKRLSVIDLNRFDLIDKVSSKGDCLCLDFDGLKNSISTEIYLGFRNSTVKIWDLRSKRFPVIKNLKSFNSIINISKINEFDVVCSSIGALNSNSLNLYDTRMGFDVPKLQYQSNKNISNIFNENFQLIDGSRNGFKKVFILQNPDIIEFFEISNPSPFKTISRFDISDQGSSEIRLEGLYFDDESLELYTSYSSNLMIYK